MSNGVERRGGSAKEGPYARGGSELGSYEDLMNVSRNLVRGGSICCVVRAYEALGGTLSNAVKRAGGSAKEDSHVRGGRGGGGGGGGVRFDECKEDSGSGKLIACVLRGSEGRHPK